MVNRGAVCSIEDSGRGPNAEALYMPGTSGCLFFYADMKRKGGSVPRPRVFGSDGESAGGNGREVTLWLPSLVYPHKTTCGI